ncbi:MAG: hypothetical protein WC859_09175 [Elusimicrobiota bacterium]|jgi:hypothetical protein
MKLTIKIGPAVIRFIADTPPHDWPHEFCGVFEDRNSLPPTVTIQVRTDAPKPHGKPRFLYELPNQWRVYQERGRVRLEILEQMHFLPRQVCFITPKWDQIDLHLIPLTYRSPGLRQKGWYLGDVAEPLIQWWLTGWLALRRKGMILHGAAVSLSGKGLAFIGHSGAGKTTISRLFRTHSSAQVLNDERILLWREGKHWHVAGTPWHGELRQVSKGAALLKRFSVLVQATDNQFLPRPPQPVLKSIFTEAYLPLWNQEAMARLVEAATRLVKDVPSGELRFTQDNRIVRYLYERV